MVRDANKDDDPLYNGTRKSNAKHNSIEFKKVKQKRKNNERMNGLKKEEE